RLNGFGVLEQLRQSANTASIPTIIITAMSEYKNVVHGLNLGADDVLKKPFHPQELLARVETKLKAHALERALQDRSKELEILLRVSDELGQRLDVSELVEFALSLLADLIPCDLTLVCFLDDDQTINQYHTYYKHGAFDLPKDFFQAMLANFMESQHIQHWQGDEQIKGFETGLIAPIIFRDTVRGMIGVTRSHPYATQYEQLLM